MNYNYFKYLVLLNLILAIIFIFIQVGYMYIVTTNICGWFIALETVIELNKK